MGRSYAGGVGECGCIDWGEDGAEAEGGGGNPKETEWKSGRSR